MPVAGKSIKKTGSSPTRPERSGGTSHVKKSLAVLMAAVFMAGLGGVALADEKPDDKAKTEKPADAQKMMKAKTANGIVKSAGADSIAVMGKGKDAEWTFAIDDKTMIKKGGKAVAAADIKPGDSVQVRYMEHDGKAVAQSVTVKAGGAAKKDDAAKNPCAGKK